MSNKDHGESELMRDWVNHGGTSRFFFFWQSWLVGFGFQLEPVAMGCGPTTFFAPVSLVLQIEFLEGRKISGCMYVFPRCWMSVLPLGEILLGDVCASSTMTCEAPKREIRGSRDPTVPGMERINESVSLSDCQYHSIYKSCINLINDNKCISM